MLTSDVFPDAIEPTAYGAYLQSEHWQQIRREAIARAKGRCQLCNRSEKQGAALDVHHRSYARLGHERPEDLYAICTEHHGDFHQGYAVWDSDGNVPPTLPHVRVGRRFDDE